MGKTIKTRLVEMAMNSDVGNEMKQRISNEIVEKQKQEAVFRVQKIREATSSVARKERYDAEWRPLTTTNVKYLTPMDQYKMHKICYYLYDKNGIGHRIIERYKDFVVGDGITYDIDDTEVREVIDEHWSINDWDLYQYQMIAELSLYGEQIYPTFVNDISGRVKLGYLDPEQVTNVLTDIENVKKRTEVIYVARDETDQKGKKIINLDEDLKSETYGYLVGETFFFAINNVTNQPRGRSDLFPLADSIDAYENFLFNRAERADILTRIIYDLELQGKTQAQIDEILEEFSIPRANEVFGHNEKTKLNITVPELGSDDASGEAKLLFNHILGGAGFPPHWFAGGEGLTRATAVAMDLPTKKQLKTRQRYFRWILSFIFRYAIHQAILKKKLTKDKKNVKIKFNLPKIEEKELAVVATALVNITNSLVIATEEGWVTSSTAKKVYAYTLSNVGVEIEAIKEEQTKESKEEMDKKLKNLYEKRKAGLHKNEEEEE